MAKKANKGSIFERDLDEYKANIDKKIDGAPTEDKLIMLQWIQIGMLRRIGRFVMGLDDGTEDEKV